MVEQGTDTLDLTNAQTVKQRDALDVIEEDEYDGLSSEGIESSDEGSHGHLPDD